MKNIKGLLKEQCCGCSLCDEVCSEKAISMKYDQEGFLYPAVDDGHCIGCGKCLRYCPQITQVKPENNKLLGEYIAFSKQISEIEKSASGSIATALYRKMIDEGGYVVGVRWNEKMDGTAEYHMTNLIDEIEAFRGSKYVQAEKGDIYACIKNVIDSGKKLLVIGLPCEIAAIKKFFSSIPQNLYLCDLICYGPTSTLFLKDYLSDITRKFGHPATNISMRYKVDKKERPYLRIDFSNGKYFLKPFYQTDIGLAFSFFGRKNCSYCKYGYLNSVADITLGDFVEEKDNHIFHGTGTSRILTWTRRGEHLVKNLDDICLQETTGLSESFFFKRKCRKNDDIREKFSRDYLFKGYKYAIRRRFGVIRRILHGCRDRAK